MSPAGAAVREFKKWQEHGQHRRVRSSLVTLLFFWQNTRCGVKHAQSVHVFCACACACACAWPPVQPSDSNEDEGRILCVGGRQTSQRRWGFQEISTAQQRLLTAPAPRPPPASPCLFLKVKDARRSVTPDQCSTGPYDKRSQNPVEEGVLPRGFPTYEVVTRNQLVSGL